MVNKLPVFVLSGFLGAGKTTVLNHLLRTASGVRIGVIVNDLSAVNIDADLIVRTDQDLVELSNGCICCTLRDELLSQVVQLATRGGLDALVIESTGVSEPLPVAQGFVLEVNGTPLRDVARLDAMVTVVDAESFSRDFESTSRVEERLPDAPAEDRRSLADLLSDQVEFADILIVNKADLVSEAQLRNVTARLRALNPSAALWEATFGAVDPKELLKSERFDYDVSMSLPAWERELSKPHVPETVEYGIGNFALVSERPFHPQRLYRFFSKNRRDLLRAKGWFTLASQPGAQWQFHLAGGKKKIEWDGWTSEGSPRAAVRLVFIGLFGDKPPRWKRDLEACLMKPGETVRGSDPFAAYLARVTG